MRLEDLKRGMRCIHRNGVEFIVSRTNNREIEYLDRKQREASVVYNINGDLTHEYNESLDIMKVEDITLDGYKTIWEREDKKYYLKIPEVYGEEYYLNYRIEEDSFYLSNEYEIGGLYKTKFTEEEIYNLPRQNFIQGIEKVEVK